MPHGKELQGGADMARKIWLAGIGAYGRAFTEAQASLQKMTDETSRVFEDLVAKGEEIEEAVEAKGAEVLSSVRAPAASLDERIRSMRSKLKMGEESNLSRLGEIEDRLAAIETKIDSLVSALAGAKPETPPRTARKSPAKRAETSDSEN